MLACAAVTLVGAAYFLPAHLASVPAEVIEQPEKPDADGTRDAALELLPARPIFRYSVIPGGAYSAAELTAAVERDPVVASVYRTVADAGVHPEVLPADRLAYMSYRIGDRVYWTKHTVRLRAGETVLAGGDALLRGRCGNQISLDPMLPTADAEPAPLELEALVEPQEPGRLSFERAEALAQPVGDRLGFSQRDDLGGFLTGGGAGLSNPGAVPESLSLLDAPGALFDTPSDIPAGFGPPDVDQPFAPFPPPTSGPGTPPPPVITFSPGDDGVPKIDIPNGFDGPHDTGDNAGGPGGPVTPETPVVPVPTPEPGTLLLVGGGGGVAAWRRRQRRDIRK